MQEFDSLQYIDAHVHLNFDQFDDDQEEVTSKMKKRGVGAINIGIDEKTSRESIRLAKKHDHIWASVGCHPTEADDGFSNEPYQEMLKDDKDVVAVGECGFDYSRSEYRSDKNKQLQKDVFVFQITLAAKTDLPLILHIRPRKYSMDAYEDGLDILTHFQNQTDRNLTGTAHFFVGNKDIAKQFLDLGFYISFTGPLTQDSNLQEVCAYIPQDRLLAETDSPFAPPQSFSHSRNSPLAVPIIAEKIADIKDLSADAMRKQLAANTARLFSLGTVEKAGNL
jgi:TatD DNase family protein